MPPIDGQLPSKADRAEARGSWRIRRAAADTDAEDRARLLTETTAEQRFEMAMELSIEAWELAGLPFPTYARSEAPVRILRGEAAIRERRR